MEDITNIDVRKLERLYFEASVELRKFDIVLDNLRSENQHLRDLIQVLVQSK